MSSHLTEPWPGHLDFKESLRPSSMPTYSTCSRISYSNDLPNAPFRLLEEGQRERPQLSSVFLRARSVDWVRGGRGFKYQTCTDEKWAGDGKEKCNAVIFPFPLASRTAFFRWPPTPPHSLLLGGRMRAGLKCGIKRPGSERGRRTPRHRGRSDKLRRR